jgi:ribosomal protein S18 acetylase RimI-like enzyme
LIIRKMLISDYENVFDLWAGTAGMGMRNLDDSKDSIDRFLKRNPDTSFVAVEDNAVIGVILCGHDGRRAYIYHTAVKNDYRRNGIGEQLVNTVINALKTVGINKAALVVFKDNKIGNDFWQSIGFTERTDLIYRNISLNADNI